MAEVALAATVAEAGTVSEALLSERATTVPPVGADWFRVTMHVVDALELKLVGLQAKAVTSMGATRVKVAVWEAPFSVAVTVADWGGGRGAAEAVTRMGATRVKVAVWEAPFSVALTVADWVVVRVAAEAVKVAEVALAGTVTDAGAD